MTAAAAVRRSPEFVAALGFCPQCYLEGAQIPAATGATLCTVHLHRRVARPVVAGQLALVDVAPIPRIRRVPQPTGQQDDCVRCVAAGKPEPAQGLSERFPGDPRPLCIPCWRGELARRFPGAAARWRPDRLAEVPPAPPCEVCGLVDGGPGRVRSSSTAVGHHAPDEAAGAGGQRPCWRCGLEPDGYGWLAQVRAAHEAERAQAVRAQQRSAELAGAAALARAQVRAVRARLAEAQGWQERLRLVLADLPAMTKTGPRGKLRVRGGPGRRARAWLLTADFLARFHAERAAAGHVSGRGRPPVIPFVAAAMAVDADYRSGRRAMPGLQRLAWLLGVSPTTVTNAYRAARRTGWAELVEAGGACSLAEKRATGHGNRRAVFDLVQLHTSTVDRVPFLGEAARLLARLLERALVLVEELRAELAEAQQAAETAAAAAATQAALVAQERAEDLAWQAELAAPRRAGLPGRDGAVATPEYRLAQVCAAAWAQQAAAAAATARRLACEAAGRSSVHDRTLAVDRAAQAADTGARQVADAVLERARWMEIFCDPPRRSTGERFTSSLNWGLTFGSLPRETLTLTAGRRRPNGRGEDQPHHGASRSTMKENRPAHPVERPRTPYAMCAPEQRKRPAPTWASWANPLARALMDRLDCLTLLNRRAFLPRIAAVLGPRLSADWTAADVQALLERYAGVHTLLGPGQAHSPLRYLATLLDRALANPAARLVAHSPVRARLDRARAGELAAAAADRARTRAAAGQVQDEAAAAERTGARPGRAQARAIAAAGLGGLDRNAARTAEARRGKRAAEGAVDWPEPTKPGAGQPLHDR